MSNITNLFSNLNDLVKSKSVTDSASDYTKNNSKLTSLSLKQGNKFHKKMKDQVNRISGVEGFQTNNLTQQTNDLLQKTNISDNKQETIQNLKLEYDSTLTQYEDLLATVNSATSDYINRVNPNNPYLGKVIQLQGGQLFYVTNQGVAKYIPSSDVYNQMTGQNGFPVKGQTINVAVSWDNSYQSQGATIPTKPTLITGTPIQVGQSVGNEGSNVFVNTIINNPISKYRGCYADNVSSPLMTFIGGAPSSSTSNTNIAIVNGNFSQPQVSNNSYKSYMGSNTDVPGWFFNAYIFNNMSSKTPYIPIPYPGGNQCAAISSNEYIYQVINLTAGTYTLSFSASSQGSNTLFIEVASTNSTPTQATQTFNATPSQNTWTSYTETFNITTSGPFQITFVGTYGGGWSCIANVSLSSSVNTTPAGTYTYNMCQQASISEGYKYFALQNVNTNTSQGYCAVSNDEIISTKSGNSFIASKQILLWSSNTKMPGSYAIFNNGSLNVVDPSGVAIFSTPNNKSQPSNYIGCYADKSTRAMTNTVSSSGQLIPATGPYSNSFGFQQCQQVAQQNNMSYFGLQNSKIEGQAMCFTSNDLSKTKQYGVAKNCTKFPDGTWQGGGWSNAVYGTSPSMNYFLILQSDGNMSIYLGSGPNDEQGKIWSAGTNGKQQQGNSSMISSNNKFGQNWMPNTSVLYPGEYLSSTKGDLVLIMQPDGNLVLCTYQTSSNCQKMADGNTGGGPRANALYELSQVGVPTNMSQLAYIDQDSQLYPYPNTNTQYTNTYTTMLGTDSQGNDISGAAYGNATVDQCQTSCNNNTECAGFSFSNNTCYPKTSSMYPNGDMQVNPNVNLYIRNKIPQNPPVGVSTTTNNIDTVLYQNYVNGGEIGDSYGISNATTIQKQQLQQLQTKLNLLSNQMNNLTNQYETSNQQLQQQSQTNAKGLNNYIKDIKTTNKKLVTFNTNVDNIVNESDIVVLQKNYDYLFWSIIAVTTVIVSMNIIKK